jgi:RNA polymerase sigma factor (TIGR02999 family)
MTEDITQILGLLKRGTQGADAELFARIHADLHRIADRYMRSERRDHTLQATVLVDEAFMQLTRRRDIDWQCRAHFIGMAAQTMRRILVDYARAKRSQKRGGAGQSITFKDNVAIAVDENPEQVVAVHKALEMLDKLDARQAKIVELRLFAGLNGAETAEVLGVAERTVKRDWRLAKAFLRQQIGFSAADSADVDD